MNSCVFMILAIFAVALKVDANCEVGWYTYRDHCYYFSMDTKSVENAKSYCQSIGGYLARIESKEENDYLKGIAVSRRSGDIWFDLTDSVKEGHWIYSANGKSTQFTDWNKGEPNAGKSANCAGLYKHFGYEWDDYGCGTARYYICEKRSKPTTERKCARMKFLLDSLAACRKNCKRLWSFRAA